MGPVDKYEYAHYNSESDLLEHPQHSNGDLCSEEPQYIQESGFYDDYDDSYDYDDIDKHNPPECVIMEYLIDSEIVLDHDKDDSDLTELADENERYSLEEYGDIDELISKEENYAENELYQENIYLEKMIETHIFDKCEDEAKMEQASYKSCQEIYKSYHEIKIPIRDFTDSSSSTRNSAVKSLVKLGEPAVPSMIKCLNDPKDEVRRKACDVLGLIGDERAVEPLNKKLKDHNKFVRRRAANALLLLSDPRSVKPLIEALGDSEKKVRIRAAKALGEIGDPLAYKPLLKCLNDSSFRVRIAAGNSLDSIQNSAKKELKITRSDIIQMKNSKDTKRIIYAYYHSDTDIRKFIIKSLSQTGDSWSVKILDKLSDKDSEIAKTAMKTHIELIKRKRREKGNLYDNIKEKDIELMRKGGDIKGLLEASVLSSYENSRHQPYNLNEVKEGAFNFIVNEIGDNAVNELNTLLNNPDPEICSRSIEAIVEIAEEVRKSNHKNFINKYKNEIDKLISLQDYNKYGDVGSKSNDALIYLVYSGRDVNSFIELKNELKKSDSEIYKLALRDITKIEHGIKEYRIKQTPSTSLHRAFSSLKRLKNHENGEISHEASRACKVLSIDWITELEDADILIHYDDDYDDNRNTEPTKELARAIVDEIERQSRPNFLQLETGKEKRKRITKKIIDENDEYMDDIIAGLYGRRR